MTRSSPTFSPYHPGELEVQQRAGVQQEAAWNGQMVRPALTRGAAHFLQDQRLAFITAVGARGLLWCSPLASPGGLFTVTSPTLLLVHERPDDPDPLADALRPGLPVGMTAIDFVHRRRLRVNGHILATDASSWTLSTNEVYGNCPKYIRSRGWPPLGRRTTINTAGPVLDRDGEALLRQADTAVLGTCLPDAGNDASHRGGPPGFLRALDARTVEWDDYVGNAMFNSLGNIAATGSACLLVLGSADHDLLQLSGRAELLWDAHDPGDGIRTNRRVRLHLDWVVLRRSEEDVPTD